MGQERNNDFVRDYVCERYRELSIMNGDNRGNLLWTAWSMVQRTVTVFLSRKTPWYVKVALGAGLLYALSPYDLIPEWVPVFGVLDDLALALLLIAWASGYHEG